MNNGSVSIIRDSSGAGIQTCECTEHVAKANLRLINMLLSVCCVCAETIHFELLAARETIASKKCFDRFTNHDAVIQEK